MDMNFKPLRTFRVRLRFPKLSAEITSAETTEYNC